MTSLSVSEARESFADALGQVSNGPVNITRHGETIAVMIDPVFIRGHQVGHIPEALAPEVFEALERKGGTATLGARLWLDDENSKPGKSSVQLFLDSRLGL